MRTPRQTGHLLLSTVLSTPEIRTPHTFISTKSVPYTHMREVPQYTGEGEDSTQNGLENLLSVAQQPLPLLAFWLLAYALLLFGAVDD